MPLVTALEWKTFLDKHPNAHLLQTAEWGLLKRNFNWKVIHVIVGEVGAQVLLRRILPGVTMAYIPKGPVGVTWDHTNSNQIAWLNLLKEIDTACHQEKAFLLKIEPDQWEMSETSDHTLVADKPMPKTAPPVGFRESTHSIQPPRTLVVDLSGKEEQILGRMKQKTRYNIGLARRKSVVIHPSADVDTFFHLMQMTGERDQFFVHDVSYYHMAYDLFHPPGYCELLIADCEDKAIAGLMVFAVGDRSWYLFGASSDMHRERMPSYLLQWEAMRWAKGKGCREYDLWGVPDEGLKMLEGQFMHRRDGLWGVYRFKRGFGGELRRTSGPWDRVFNPLLYSFYLWWVKRKTSIT